jgi:hypothetical protein
MEAICLAAQRRPAVAAVNPEVLILIDLHLRRKSRVNTIQEEPPFTPKKRVDAPRGPMPSYSY